jgi:hypothetical protein
LFQFYYQISKVPEPSDVKQQGKSDIIEIEDSDVCVDDSFEEEDFIPLNQLQGKNSTSKNEKNREETHGESEPSTSTSTRITTESQVQKVTRKEASFVTPMSRKIPRKDDEEKMFLKSVRFHLIVII